MPTHTIDVDGLVAVDVHVHLEHTGEQTEADKKAAAYFKGGGARDAASLAEYYRSRKMACVIFTVDETLSGTPRLSNDAVLEFAAQNPDIALPFVSINPTRGAEAVREAKRLVATGQVRKRTDWSPDGKFYRCACDYNEGHWVKHQGAFTRCVFVPLRSASR